MNLPDAMRELMLAAFTLGYSEATRVAGDRTMMQPAGLRSERIARRAGWRGRYPKTSLEIRAAIIAAYNCGWATFVIVRNEERAEEVGS